MLQPEDCLAILDEIAEAFTRPHVIRKNRRWRRYARMMRRRDPQWRKGFGLPFKPSGEQSK